MDAYNSAVGSLERQVLPGARKFTELGVQAQKPLEPVPEVDLIARTPRGEPSDKGDASATEEGTEIDTPGRDAESRGPDA